MLKNRLISDVPIEHYVIDNDIRDKRFSFYLFSSGSEKPDKDA